jgi:hypothetical protein
MAEVCQELYYRVILSQLALVEPAFPESEYPNLPWIVAGGAPEKSIVDEVAPGDISAGISQPQEEPGYCEHCRESPC